MRIALAILIAGCASPTGLDQTWPPKLGLTVETVTTGDLDGDGQPEVLVYATGNDHTAGIYAIEGHDDLALGTQTPVTAFDTFVPMPFTRPIAAAQGVGSDGVPRVFTGYYDTFHEIVVDVLTNQYGSNGGYETDLPSGSAFLWLRPVMFPHSTTRVVVGNGNTIEHTADDGTDAQMIAPPSGAAWPTASLASTFTTGSDAWTLVIATPSEIWRAPIATTLAWTQVRNGAAWAGQTALDLDGNGREEIVGLDLTAHSVCAIDVVDAMPSCVSLGATSAGTEISIVVAYVAGVATAPDLVIAQATATDTTISVIADVTFAGDTLAGTTMAIAPVSFPHGRAVVVDAGVGTPEAVLVFSGTGNAICMVGGC